jgi:hypothetical protein
LQRRAIPFFGRAARHAAHSLALGSSFVCLDAGDGEGCSPPSTFHPTYLSAGFHPSGPSSSRPWFRRRSPVTASAARDRGTFDPEDVDRSSSCRRSGDRRYGATKSPASPMTGFRRTRKRGAVGIPTAGGVGRWTDGTIRGRGTIGEIVVRGPLVFDGYLDDRSSTPARLPANGFAPAISAAWTRTVTCSSTAGSRK